MPWACPGISEEPSQGTATMWVKEVWVPCWWAPSCDGVNQARKDDDVLHVPPRHAPGTETCPDGNTGTDVDGCPTGATLSREHCAAQGWALSPVSFLQASKYPGKDLAPEFQREERRTVKK